MQIKLIECPDYIEDKLIRKHNVTVWEAKQVIFNRPRIRFAEKGYTENNDIYAAFGQTLEGRYLSVFFIYKPDVKIAVIISARDMSEKEKKAYVRK